MTNSLTTLCFPKSRSALWDGSPTGEKILLHLCAHRYPRLLLLEKALRLAQRHVRHSSKTRFQCFFLGSISVDSDEEGVTLTLDRFDPGRDQNGARVPSAVLPGDVLVPCVFTSDSFSEPVIQSQSELLQTFKVLQQAVSGRQSLDMSQLLKIQVHVVCSQRSDSADFGLSWTCVCPAASVHVQPVRAVPVIPTALLRSLTSPARPPGQNRQKGFVTMDQSRKLLLLLESDPKACSLPLVGLWFSGATHVHSPQVWAWTLRFLYSSSLQDRVLSESGCFLLVLFGATHRAPQFYQCRASRSGSRSQLDCRLLTAHLSTTLYQQVATAEGQTLQCDLSSEAQGRQTEVFREAQSSFNSAAGPALGLSVSDQDSGVEDEDLSPRPSPSPHLPAQQAQRIQPSVPELSLLIDGSFLSNHNASPAPRAPPLDRKSPTPPLTLSSSSAPAPLQLHSTPHSNLQPNCLCCSSNGYDCTSIQPTLGQPQIPQKTPQTYQQTPPVPQNLHQTPTNIHQSPTDRPQTHQNPTISQNHHHFNLNPVHHSPLNHHQTPPQHTLDLQQASVASPDHPQTPISTLNLHPALRNCHQTPSNMPQNVTSLNYTLDQAQNIHQHRLKMPQIHQNPSLNLFQTPQSSSKAQHTPPSFSNAPQTLSNVELLAQNHSQTPSLPQCNPRGAAVLPLSCPCSHHPPPPLPALPPVVCARPCYEQQGALSGETYQLFIQQDRQLRLLQQQVQMLLEAQGKLQSTQQQTETQTKTTASIAVGTGASLFWPEPPPLHQDSPRSVTPASSSSLPHCQTSPRSVSRLSSPDPQDAPCSPRPSQNGLSSVESPVLGESVSMYTPEDDQHSFYHNLMTQVNSRLQDSGVQLETTQQEVKESKQEEDSRRRSLPNCPQSSPAHSFHSSASAPVSRRKNPPRPDKDPVVSATLRRLQELGVNLDKEELSESDRTRNKAIESASTLACINPAAVASRLCVSESGLSCVFPGDSVDLSLEANAIALRYLSDKQLTRLSLSGHAPKSSNHAPSSNDITLLSPTNMSLATRKYMKRYGLIEDDDDEEEVREPLREALNTKLLPQSQLIRELRPKMKLLAGKQNGGGADKENGAPRRDCHTLEPQGSVGNILDLSRLRQLPKLF